VLAGLDPEQVLQFFQFSRVLRGQVVCFAEVLRDVKELPFVLGEVIAAGVLPWEPAMPGYGDPAIMIERAIAEHLEVLGMPLLFRAGLVKTVDHADALDRLLRDAVEFSRRSNTRRLQDGGHKVTWWNWARMPPLSLMRAGHEMTTGLRVPPK